MIAIAGLPMVLLGARTSLNEQMRADCRSCRLYAEAIKNAALKCKHWGAEVKPATTPRLKDGWVASTACRDEEEEPRTIAALQAPGFRFSMTGLAVSAGPFETKDEAKQALATMRDGPRL